MGPMMLSTKSLSHLTSVAEGHPEPRSSEGIYVAQQIKKKKKDLPPTFRGQHKWLY